MVQNPFARPFFSRGFMKVADSWVLPVKFQVLRCAQYCAHLAFLCGNGAFTRLAHFVVLVVGK